MSSIPYRILIADDEPSILNAYSSVLLANGQLKQADAGLDDLEAELSATSTSSPTRPTSSSCASRDSRPSARSSARRPTGVPSRSVPRRAHAAGMNGVDTAKEIRTIDPGLNIVFVTGYSDTDPRDMAKIRAADRARCSTSPSRSSRSSCSSFASALSNKWRAEQDLVVAHELLKANMPKLEVANVELAAAKHRRGGQPHEDRFLANVSHELRTAAELHHRLQRDDRSRGPRPHRQRALPQLHPRHSTRAASTCSGWSTTSRHLQDRVGEFELQEDEIDIGDIIESTVRVVQ